MYLRDFAKCVAKFSHDPARRFVLATGEQSVSDEDLRRVLHGYCASLWGPGPLFDVKALQLKGVLAEALNQRDNRAWPSFDPRVAKAIDWSVPQPKPLNRPAPLTADEIALRNLSHELAVTQNKVGHLGECIVRANPSGAVDVLNTTMDDPSELVALKALTPAIVGCVRSGEVAAFNRTDLRSAIALSYYRLANPDAPLAH